MAEAEVSAGSRVAGNAAALLSARLVSGVATLLATPFLFALLGPRQFGLWALLLGTVAIAGLADLGFSSAQVREVARAAATGERRRAQGALALGLMFYGALALALLAAVWVGWDLFAKAFHLGELAASGRDTALLLAVSFAVDAVATPWRAALEGNQRMRPLAAITAASTVFSAALGVLLVAAGAGLPGLGWAALATSALRAGLTVGAAERRARGLRPSLRALRRDEIRPLLGYGARVQTTNVASTINADAGRLLLGAVFSPVVVAPFELGSRLAGAMRIVPWFVLTALFPAAAELQARGERAQLDDLYLRATRYLALFSSVSAAGLIAGAEPLVELWIGRPLPFAATTIVLLAPAYALNLTGGAAAAVTRAEGAPGRETRSALLALVLYAPVTLPLLWALGPAGVPLGISVSLALATSYFLAHFHRATGRPLGSLVRAVWKPFAAAGLVLALTPGVLDLLPESPGRLGAAVAVASHLGLVGILTLGVLAALRFFDARDRAAVRRLLERLRPPAPMPLPISLRGERPW